MKALRLLLQQRFNKVKMKKTVYLDTTIPSYYYDERESIRAFIDITKQWWNNERQHHDLLTSETTIAEINSGNYPRKKEIIELIREIEILEINKEIENIVEVYIKELVMPKGAPGDAFHLACASFYKVDYLLTWNCNHLANANKKQHIQMVNSRLSLFIPQIITPLELFIEKDG